MSKQCKNLANGTLFKKQTNINKVNCEILAFMHISVYGKFEGTEMYRMHTTNKNIFSIVSIVDNI